MNPKRNAFMGTLMLVIGLFILYLSITMERQEITDPASGSFIPGLVSVIMIGCGVNVLVRRKRSIESGTVEKEKNDSSHLYTVGLFFLVTLLFVISLSFLPFTLAAFLFLFILFFILKGMSLKRNLFISVGTVAVIYFVFESVFQIVFP